jgi:hypothetical protein
MSDMMTPRVRTNAGDNGSVNPVFGKIAQSANFQKGDNDSAEKRVNTSVGKQKDDDDNEKQDNEGKSENEGSKKGAGEIRKPNAEGSKPTMSTLPVLPTASKPKVKKSLGGTSNGAY